MKITFFICAVSSLFFTSCSQYVPSYTVDGSGLDWQTSPVQTVPADKVTPNVALPLPSQLGGGTIVAPIQIAPAK